MKSHLKSQFLNSTAYRRTKKAYQRGLTLIEVVIVIAIIGVLSASLIFVGDGLVDDARASSLNSQTNSLTQGLEVVSLQTGCQVKEINFLDKVTDSNNSCGDKAKNHDGSYVRGARYPEPNKMDLSSITTGASAAINTMGTTVLLEIALPSTEQTLVNDLSDKICGSITVFAVGSSQCGTKGTTLQIVVDD